MTTPPTQEPGGWGQLPRAMMVQASRVLGLLGSIEPASALDLNLLRRVLLHAALVGVAAGLVGAFFFASVEWLQWVLLENAAGFHPLHAHGEALIHVRPEA